LLKFADLGMADVEFNKGQYDTVLKSTQKVVDKVLSDAKSVKGDGPVRYKDHKITASLLGLALRANIQKGDIDRSKELLGVLQRLQGTEDGVAADRSSEVRRILKDIGEQVDALRASTKKEDAEKLKETVGRFSAFVDIISKDSEKKGFDPESTRMLAMAYASLNEHRKAADIFAKVPPPATLDKDAKKLSEDEKQLLAVYWNMRLQYAKALHEDALQERNFAEANRKEAKGDPGLESQRQEALKKEKACYTESLKVLDHLLRHPNAKYQVLAEMERNLVLEDEGRYSVAFAYWSKFLKNPSLTNALTEPEVQKIYFTGLFYKTRVMYKYAQYEAKADKRQTYTASAAKTLVTLEFTPDGIGWGIIKPMAEELLKAEDPLREEYEKLKKDRMK
jgi:hypothetical protein